MSDAFLRLRFDDDGDGIGELIASAKSGSFSGTGRAYFNIDKIEKFADAIADFSLSNEPHSIAGGCIGTGDRRGELDQEHLGITVYPIDSRGYIGMQIRMATPVLTGERPESRKSATIELVTTHEPLSRFGRHLIAVLRGHAEEAVLIGNQ
jgi:hypothetical protein